MTEMNGANPRKVVIAGGGTAGWMAATYLQRALGDRIQITLVESDSISTIGVGEATFSTIRLFFRAIGLEEREWMPACNATYKLGIRFVDWRKPGHDFYHPFERPAVVQGFPLAEWWLRCRPTERFDRDSFVLAGMCDAMLSPHTLDGVLFEQQDDASADAYRTTTADDDTQYPYAYHFDAAMLARYLAKIGTARGITRLVDTIVDVRTGPEGIAGLVTSEHGLIEGDLYVDCTGFRGLLLSKALGVPFISFQDTLPNDRAVALRVPADIERDGIRPYTTATAMDAGWMWTIPLFGRNGMGYVYSSQFSTEDEAERALRLKAGPAAEGLEANHIRMRIGRSRESWVRNCVAIGLASGFVEPLESTGIFFIQQGVDELVKHFPGENFDPQLVADYNRVVARCIEGIREFLSFHYFAAARTDNDYWRATKERPLPGDLAERTKLWQHKLPDAGSIYPYHHGFEAYSWATLLVGLGGLSVRQRPIIDVLDPAPAMRAFADIRRRGKRLADTLPSQHAYFENMRRTSQADLTPA